MKRLAGALLFFTACHPRVPAEEAHRDPVPLCAVQRVARERIDGTALVVELTVSDVCLPSDQATTTELARVELETAAGCPAGQVLLEVGGGERVRLPELAARIEPAALRQLKAALWEFSSKSPLSYGRAFVVGCSDPRWLFFATGADGSARAELYRVEPEAPRPAEPALPPMEPEPRPRTPLVTGTCAESLEVGAKVWVGRRLGAGMLPGPSSLSTWTLGRTGNLARLVIQDFRAPKQGGPPANEQPEGQWECVRSTAWEGTVSGTPLRFSLSQGDGGQVLELTCGAPTVELAGASARRVRVPSTEEGCNASVWRPAVRRKARALSCVPADDGPAATPFFLAERPGVEHVTFDNDDCGDPAAALRGVPRDGGVATAVKLSEQPDAFVPASLGQQR